MGQLRSLAALLDHLVGVREHGRHIETECLGGSEFEHVFDYCALRCRLPVPHRHLSDEIGLAYKLVAGERDGGDVTSRATGAPHAFAMAPDAGGKRNQSAILRSHDEFARVLEGEWLCGVGDEHPIAHGYKIEGLPNAPPAAGPAGNRRRWGATASKRL